MNDVICPDDLSGADTRALLALHLSGMQANSPPENVHALDLSALRTPDITVWSLARAGTVIGIAALRQMDPRNGELKSMRTDPAHLRTGVAAALLTHILAVARARGYARVSLETGSGAGFEPALALYRRAGFVNGPAFSDYVETPFNQFLHLDL